MKLSSILKTEGIITVAPDDNLSHALNQLASSHDAAFVVDSTDTLMGVINPYHCLINNSYPGNAKVAHCLIKPPKVTMDTSLAEVARLMAESKIHYLPIYDEMKKFVGIISARRLLSHLVTLPEANQSLKQVSRSGRQIKSIFEDDKISKALNMFKQFKVSKLIVLSKENRLKGVLTFYDLISYLASPKEREHSGDRRGNKTPFLNYHVRNFMKTIVLTLPHDASIAEAVRLILDKRIGSVVLVDQDKRPIDIITTRDLFNYFFKKAPVSNLQVMSRNLTGMSKAMLSNFGRRFVDMVSRRGQFVKATLFVEEKGKGMFKVLFSMIPRRGKREFIKREGRDLQEVLSDVKKTVKEIEAKK